MRRLLTSGLLVLAPSVLACGRSHHDAPVPTLTPPSLGAGIRSLGEGEIVLAVAPGAAQAIDPLALARSVLPQPPPCAGFVFAFSWQMRPGQSVRFRRKLQGNVSDVAQGAAGEASIGGCTLILAGSDASTAVQGRLRYVIGDAAP